MRITDIARNYEEETSEPDNRCQTRSPSRRVAIENVAANVVYFRIVQKEIEISVRRRCGFQALEMDDKVIRKNWDHAE